MKVGDLFRPGGAISKALPDYEFREGQMEMAEQVQSVMETGGTLMVEAGTGIGKSFAYLAPALLSGKRVVVSTATRNLQDQLFRSDLPRLVRALRLDPNRTRYARLKGRDNYLCKLLWQDYRQQDAGALLSRRNGNVRRVASWAKTTPTGDMGEIPGVSGNLDFWSDVSTSRANCIGRKCSLYDECHLVQARRAATGARVVVVNHYLLMADRMLREDEGGGILPDYDRLVVDEAHRLEDAATKAFGISVSSSAGRNAALEAGRVLKHHGRPAPPALKNLPEIVEGLFRHLTEKGERTDRAFDPNQLPQNAHDLGQDAQRQLQVIEGALSGVVEEREKAVDALGAEARGKAVEELARSRRILNRVKDLRDDLEELLRPRPNYVHWTNWRSDEEANGRRRDQVAWASTAPVRPGDDLHRRLFDDMKTTVLTSATLAVDGSFDYARMNFGVRPTRSAVHPSPFDFSRSRLYVPDDLPAPQGATLKAWEEQAIGRIRALATASRGRALVLFTSTRMVETAKKALRNAPFLVLAQNRTGRDQLLQRFKSESNAVLLATRSFWEGVDVPGRALSLLIIDKLPFPVPSDPVISARTEHAQVETGSGFTGYSVPQAALALKQGLGRLIRRDSDVGMCAVLDSRLVRKFYGKTILQSLPDFRRIHRQEEAEAFLRDLP